MKIKPLVGIDNIHFGLTRGQITALLGTPEASEIFTWPNDGTTENWQYPNLQIELNFDSDDDFKLTRITTYSNEAKLDGIAFVGIDEHKLKQILPEIILKDDSEANGRDYWLSKGEISFWVVDGIVNNLTLFTEFDESGQNVIWPT